MEEDCSPRHCLISARSRPPRYLVVLVDNLARIDDGEVWDEVGHFFLGLGSDEHVFREMVLPS